MMGIDYRLVVEPQEADDYARHVDPSKITVLPFANLGRGSIPARNWAWNDSLAHGDRAHWLCDDNICHFYKLIDHEKICARDASFFTEMEDMSAYPTVAFAGPHNRGFVVQTDKHYAWTMDTRIYSTTLVNNSVPFRWRGTLDEDTDLMLRALKAGWRTMLFNSHLMDKTTTGRNSGGNSKLYRPEDGRDGRLEMAKSLAAQHPDVARVGRRFGRDRGGDGRWQHIVDYRAAAAMGAALRAPDTTSCAISEAR
jgi:hypothetical protein